MNNNMVHIIIAVQTTQIIMFIITCCSLISFRFEEQESAGRPPCSFMPLGQGPRNCAGTKLAKVMLKTAVAAVLRDHRFTTAATTKPLLVKKSVGMTSCFEYDVNLKLCKRTT